MKCDPQKPVHHLHGTFCTFSHITELSACFQLVVVNATSSVKNVLALRTSYCFSFHTVFGIGLQGGKRKFKFNEIQLRALNHPPLPQLLKYTQSQSVTL